VLFGVPLDAAYHVVSALAVVFTPVLAVVVFTMLVRLLIMPLSFRALRGQAAQARIAPQVQALRKRHQKQPERLQSELSALYKREGTSMFAGFGPLLAQWPFLSVVYLLFRSPHVGGTVNTLLTRDMLGTHWLSAPGPVSLQGLAFLAVFGLLATIGYLAMRWSTPILPNGDAPSPGSTAISRVAPFVTVAFAAFSPLATGIYLVTTMAWTVAERQVFRARHDQKRE
jgi:YidC/Oxa1 family membrane protein insertase